VYITNVLMDQELSLILTDVVTTDSHDIWPGAQLMHCLPAAAVTSHSLLIYATYACGCLESMTSYQKFVSVSRCIFIINHAKFHLDPI